MARRLEQQAMRDGVSGTAEWTADTPDGRRVFVMRKTVCRDPDGRIIGTIAVSHDVTQQRAVEERMRMAQRVEAMGRLAGGVAHDFNNLLTVITVNSDLALQGADPESPTTRAFEEIRDAADRASELTRQLLAYGRRQHLNPRTLDLNELLARLHPMLRRLIPENIAVRVVPAGGLDPVTVDPVQLEQVVLNLAANARDAMPRGGHLTIETRMVDIAPGRHPHAPPMPAGRYVRLAVVDDGTGMDEATRARIFEPFFTTKALGHGTGLGLAMVYGTVKQSGGWIWVDSEPGRGATFEVLLPSAASPLAARQPGPAHGPMPRGTETVLLVEDDTVVRDISCRVLERCGYRVLLARDGAHAIAIVSRTDQPIALVVTDVVMPHMSGPELAARLTALRPGLRFLFVSGYADQGMLPTGAGEEPREFLQKPFTPESLARRVREALDAGEPGAGHPGAAGA
jgi:signal transduction histidine kinase/CheY-like chemotaxis protein